ncbi:MAG: UDP-N-acetylglucosamine 2-epimerase (non-hydrolyzing) [Planctomycetia bacterium]|nr:UDP-N-acetylglucosamine 2-epimerase (non-hydrolyzing) [Planctomycetia bacterium]
MSTIMCVVGARPNFIKIAPIMAALQVYSSITVKLTHTGQHYDAMLSDVFFHDLGLREPDVRLGVGSGSAVTQVAQIMTSFERACEEERPDAVLVVGDVNSSLACALTSVKLGVKLIHVEAGLRSHDRQMPEEINRVLIDAVSDLLFCTEESAVKALITEGRPKEKIYLVGNVMIDSLLQNLPRARESKILEELGVTPHSYAVATLHRPGAVDSPERFAEILNALETIQRDLPLIMPLHPRTRKNIYAFHFEERLAQMSNLRVLEPLGYLDFLQLNSNARVVLTDSGGLQEETTALHVPCITVRENTERPITVDVGSNQLAGLSCQGILDAYHRVQTEQFSNRAVPPLWDGHAATRIAKIIADFLG